ncbi:molybdopterin-containing oxidoreductase family membrane subunit [Geothermobacter ehrlichii]|uniref:Molybdopterin-containing oxidoreductase family membrane subunit n=1 Tax=Geothermobacter ehrlichii TaxID=213224 RepID=A0A5D3WFK3_9BACT|nr:NrfD/PsrC family molybdoenzyme membrane anchor subunit [Geothermobacter ehrlichii]TYO96639.1 molybdopterin-containing oxidoreductase family membrane subunit [Geothermobacter ehrlichii]
MTQRSIVNGMTLNELESLLVGRIKSGSNAYYLALLLCALVMLAGSVAGLQATVGGHHIYYGVSREVPWGILISTYVFFVVTSTGLCLVSAIGHVFGVSDYMPIAKRSVFLSIVTILAGFLVISAEIKVPIKMMLYNIISPNLTSNIWWMGTLYGVYLMFMFIEFACLLIDRHRTAVTFGFLGAVAGIAAHSNLGAVFGLLNGREFWHGPYMPIYFITSAMMTGTAVIIFFHLLAYRVNRRQLDAPMARSLDMVRRLAILLICVIAFFTVWKILSGIAGMPEGKYQAVMALLTGPYAINFWVFEVGLALLLPLVLFLTGRNRPRQLLIASGLMILGIFIMRYDLVIVGEVVPVFHGLGVNEFKGLLSYRPSLHELVITLGGFGMVGFLFLLGEKIFDGHKVDLH